LLALAVCGVTFVAEKLFRRGRKVRAEMNLSSSRATKRLVPGIY
jgi:hypothetical protein